MEQLVKQLAKSQKLQDIGAVIRGADRVLSSYFTNLNRSILNPLISTEPRRSQYIYEDQDYSTYDDPVNDPTKKFDIGENQPSTYKDLNATIPEKDHHKTLATGAQNLNANFKSTTQTNKGLYSTINRRFSTTMRNHNVGSKGIRPEVAEKLKIQTGVNNDKNSTFVNQNISNNNIRTKSYSEYYPDANKGPVEKIINPRREVHHRHLKERAVPSSPMARTASFAGLGFNLAASAVGGVMKNMFSNEKVSISSAVFTEENAERMSQTFSRMRGIPLKLGQVLSMQEENVIPKVISKALESAQKSADIMPRAQLNQVLENELGPNWQAKFEYFDMEPIAAASIGQVHKARTIDGIDVAVKVQYPGVLRSIDSDIKNVKRLLSYPNLLPRSLFLDDILKHIGKELVEECDYIAEARKQMEFGELLKDREGFNAPRVFPELSTNRVLTQEFIYGLNLDECLVADLSQEQRNNLGEKIFRILLVQLYNFKHMQTDPNPANFFYDAETDTLNMIDFGAAIKFTDTFVESYMKIIHGAATKDGNLVYEGSKEIGFLSGEENRELIDAHVSSVLIVGEPFAVDGPFDFGNQNLSARIYQKLPVLVEKRLRPPPQIVYSLHRMLTGGYLMCMKLKAEVHVSKIFKEVQAEYYAAKNMQNK